MNDEQQALLDFLSFQAFDSLVADMTCLDEAGDPEYHDVRAAIVELTELNAAVKEEAVRLGIRRD